MKSAPSELWFHLAALKLFRRILAHACESMRKSNSFSSYQSSATSPSAPSKLVPDVTDSVFLVESVREKHRNAPLLAEREKYLAHLFEIGGRRRNVRKIATMLLNVVRVFRLESPRPIGMNEILLGCDRWIVEENARRCGGPAVASSSTFQVVATNWLRFQGALVADPKPVPVFGTLLSRFLHTMRLEHGLAPDTLNCYRTRLLDFIIWLQSRCSEFSDVRASDVEDYLDGKGSWLRSSRAAHCSALRTFFRFAEQQQWCSRGIPNIISSPRVPRIGKHLIGPSWEDVRRLIDSIGHSKPSDIRAKAMFLLFSVYGLRSAEVRGMMLEDIDWRRGLINVRRAKRGKTQQFPLQSEVGESIALYLEKARPKCFCRHLFVTLSIPFRPIKGKSISSIINPRMKEFGIPKNQFGPHMLRRACATQLLRTGTSLRDIADFLGHSNLRTVSNYARFAPSSLMSVANFSLSGVL